MQVYALATEMQREQCVGGSFAMHQMAEDIQMENLFLGKPAALLMTCMPLARLLHLCSCTHTLLFYLQSDVLAGLAVGVMAVPQCVSFALMAGLPSAYGLYSAFLPVLAYALTGSSPQLVRKPLQPGSKTLHIL